MDFQDCETAQYRVGGIERIPMLTEKPLVRLEKESRRTAAAPCDEFVVSRSIEHNSSQHPS
jgi:hypothetical protein